MEGQRSSTSSLHGNKAMKSKLEPWDQPLDSTTTNLFFMPIDPGRKSHIDQLEQFATSGIGKVKKLTIDFTHSIEDNDKKLNAQITSVLNRILLGSVDTLEKVTLSTPIGYLGKLVIPCMPNVIKLNITIYWYGENTAVNSHFHAGELFPKGFKFKKCLPNLRDVLIQLETEVGIKYPFDLWHNCLKSAGIAKSVKNLDYSDDCGFKKEQLKKTFPNGKWAESPSPDLTDRSSEEDDEDSSEY